MDSSWNSTDWTEFKRNCSVVIANCLPEQEIEIQFRFSSLLFVCSWHKTVGRWLKSTRWRANVRGSTVCCKVFSFILSIFKWVTISEDIVRGIKSSIVSHSCFQYWLSLIVIKLVKERGGGTWFFFKWVDGAWNKNQLKVDVCTANEFLLMIKNQGIASVYKNLFRKSVILVMLHHC